jgi:protease-4
LRFGFGLLVILISILCLAGLAASSNLDDDRLDHNKPYIALVKLEGEVVSDATFSARKAIPIIQKAFKDKEARAVVLLIDSPGGSPVNASQIYHEIRRQKKLHPKTEVIAVGEDLLTSAAYLIATAADSIYVNESTITGSIGVVSSGFGFNNAITKLGVERRVFFSGAHKNRLDPFKPLVPEDETKLRHMLEIVHMNFINDVKAARGNKLIGDPSVIFSGDFWTGSEAVKLGLVDGTADLEDIMLKFKVDQYKSYTPKESFWRQLAHEVGEETTFRLQGGRNKLRAEF